MPNRPYQIPAHTVLSCPLELEAVNPYITLLYRFLRRKKWESYSYSLRAVLLGRYDIFHVHWPESFLVRRNWVNRLAGLILLCFVSAVAKMKGARVVWTAHNLKPHDPMPLWIWKLYQNCWCALVDGVIFLSAGSQKQFHQTWPRTRNGWECCIPQGHYRGWYGRPKKRKQPGKPGTFLFFGRLMKYKGIEELLESFCGLSDPELKLIIAGKAQSPGYAEQLEALARNDSRVDLRLGFIQDDEIAPLLAEATLGVLPFRQITNSASALLFWSYGVPLLVPDLPYFQELSREVDPHGRHLILYSKLTPQVLGQALENVRSVSRVQPSLKSMRWMEIARRTDAFYRKVRTTGG
jgi:glycosyltransferase involved in cell wall biosynthesis